MSQTVPVDVVNRSYWAYVASAVAEGLEKILGDDAQPNVIAPRVYEDAENFFRVALHAARGDAAANPAASIANYVIAADAARVRSEQDRADLNNSLENYATLLTRLGAGQALRPEDAATASQLKTFFLQLQKEAETETYDKVVRFDGPRLGLRLW